MVRHRKSRKTSRKKMEVIKLRKRKKAKKMKTSNLKKVVYTNLLNLVVRSLKQKWHDWIKRKSVKNLPSRK